MRGRFSLYRFDKVDMEIFNPKAAFSAEQFIFGVDSFGDSRLTVSEPLLPLTGTFKLTRCPPGEPSFMLMDFAMDFDGGGCVVPFSTLGHPLPFRSGRLRMPLRRSSFTTLRPTSGNSNPGTFVLSLIHI